MPNVDLFVVHWNQPEACIATIKAFSGQGIPLRITVIDNDSAADAFTRLQVGLEPEVNIVRLDDNKGWGGALNVSLRRWLQDETNRYCLISAHDAIPSPDCVRLLIAAAEADEQVGIACPQYSEPFVARLSPWRGVYPQTVKPQMSGTAEEVEVPHGTLLLLRRQCLEEIGLFDQRYFAYGDEHDLGARAVRSGWKVVLVWGSIVTNPGTWTETSWRNYLFARNSLYLVRAYFGRAAATRRAILILVNTVRLLACLRTNRSDFSARARCRAVRDYFNGCTGRPRVL